MENDMTTMTTLNDDLSSKQMLLIITKQNENIAKQNENIARQNEKIVDTLKLLTQLIQTMLHKNEQNPAKPTIANEEIEISDEEKWKLDDELRGLHEGDIKYVTITEFANLLTRNYPLIRKRDIAEILHRRGYLTYSGTEAHKYTVTSFEGRMSGWIVKSERSVTPLITNVGQRYLLKMIKQVVGN